MNKEAKMTAEQSALQIAYKKVCDLGYPHARLIEVDGTLTFDTLRRIKQGKSGKTKTDLYYLKVFVTLINKEYEERLHNGGDNVNELLICMKNILLATI